MLTTGIGLGSPEAGAVDAATLGGKGAGLVEMVRLGLPVPPGFVIGTSCGKAYLRDGVLPPALGSELTSRMSTLEELANRRFGERRGSAAGVGSLRRPGVHAGDDGHRPERRVEHGWRAAARRAHRGCPLRLDLDGAVARLLRPHGARGRRGRNGGRAA